MYIKIVLNVFMIIQQGCSRDILPRYRILSQKEEKNPGKFYKKNTKNTTKNNIFSSSPSL